MIARLLDLSERRIQQLSREGVIPKAERGQYDLVGAVHGYVAYLRDLAVKAQAGAPDFGVERARLIKAKADLAEMEAEGRRGELLPAEAVEAARPRRSPGCAAGSSSCPIASPRSATRRRQLPGSATRSARRSARRSTNSRSSRSSPLILTGPARLAVAVRKALSILRPPPELSISDMSGPTPTAG